MVLGIRGMQQVSVEVLVEILSYLQYRDLLRCQQVSHSLRVIIQDTPSLQYTVQLGLSGYEDGAFSQNNVVHRLESLLQVQRTWRHPQPRLNKSLTVPSRLWLEAKWYKDILSGRFPGNHRRLDLFYLSAVVPDDDRLKTFYFDIEFDSVYIDPGQDLLVLTCCSLPPNLVEVRPPPRIYLRSLKEQGPHPLAKQWFIDLAAYGFPSVPFARRLKVQISGGYMTISVFKQLIMEAILVWHWPTGTINAALHTTSDATYLTAFCTSDGYLLVNRHRRHAPVWFGIYVYAIHPAEEIPTLIATFELPKLRWDPSSLLNSAFFPGNDRTGTVQGDIAAAPTDSNPACVLIQLRMDLQHTLYTPLSTFLSDTVLHDRFRLQPLNFPWAMWGPRQSRFVHEAVEYGTVCGYRAVYTNHILDFCPYDVAHDDRAQKSPSTHQATMFAEPVVTNLPYRKIDLSFPSPSALASNQTQIVMQDVDGPKVIRATCKDFVLVPTCIDIFSI